MLEVWVDIREEIEAKDLAWRDATSVVALSRIAEAYATRGLWPQFSDEHPFSHTNLHAMARADRRRTMSEASLKGVRGMSERAKRLSESAGEGVEILAASMSRAVDGYDLLNETRDGTGTGEI